MTILGTRPEIIRLSLVIPILDAAAEHTVVHTGQNYDERLSDIFFEELSLRRPDIHLRLEGESAAAQIGSLFGQIERAFLEVHPDRVLILGDTNSGLSALIARRLGIPVYHLEAGNRCFDDRVPEEVNRRVIDHCSTVLLPYTHNSKENLLAEGIPLNRIYVIGNPIFEVLQFHRDRIARSSALQELRVEGGKFFLVTLHRAENVDDEERLRSFMKSLEMLHQKHGFPVICSLHPRTRSKLEQFGLNPKGIQFSQPFGFFDFVRLEQSAACVLSDSGTVQEECSIFRVPTVTLRDVTERPETLEVGSNILSGSDPERIGSLVDLALGQPAEWNPPVEYTAEHVSRTIARIVLSHREPDAAERRWRAGENR